MGIKIYMGIKIEFSIRFVLRGMASLRKSSELWPVNAHLNANDEVGKVNTKQITKIEIRVFITSSIYPLL